MSVSVDELNTTLLGESELNFLASGSSQAGLAFGNDLNGILNFGDNDGLLNRDIFTAHTGEEDGLVDTGLDGLGVRHFDGDIDGGDNGHVVGSFLSDLLAVVVSITTMSITTIAMVSRLADSDHLDVSFLLKGDLNSLGGGVFVLLLVRVRADFVGDLFNGFSTDCAGDSVGEFHINDDLDGQLDILADCFKGRGADLSDFSHINDSAVVFRFLITVTTISWGMVSISRGRVTISGGGVVGGSRLVATIAGGRVAGECQGKGEESQNSKGLHDVFCLS